MKYRENPQVGTHPDLFEGESPIFVSMEKLSRSEIAALPLESFSDEEWESLDKEMRKKILGRYHVDDIDDDRWNELTKEEQRQVVEQDPSAKKQLELVKKLMSDLHKFAFDPEYLHERESDSGWDVLAGFLEGHAFDRRADEYRAVGLESEIEDLVERYEAAGYTAEQVLEAASMEITDTSHWETEIESSSPYGQGTYSYEIFTDVYAEQNFIQDQIDHKEIPEVIWEMASEDLDSYEERDFWEDHWRKLYETAYSQEGYPTFQIDGLDSGYAMVFRLNEDAFLGAVEERLEDEEPFNEPEEGAEIGEDEDDYGTVLTLDDGVHVVKLRARDLPEEGKKQGFCIGKAEYGYPRAVRTGRGMALSMRKPNGKPILTFFVRLTSSGDPDYIDQIKGKGNRLPGWALGAVGPGNKFRKAEVERAIKVVEWLGLDPEDAARDLQPAIRHMKRLKEVPRENPPSCPTCCPTCQSPRTGFCAPLKGF